MCGRYATTRSEADLSRLFEAVDVTDGLGPSWNVAPTDPVPVVRVSQRRGERVLDTARWGLLPPWAKDPRAGARMINARAETVATSPAFAKSFATRRCLVPADGWFEWAAAPTQDLDGGASTPVPGGGAAGGRRSRSGRRKQAYYLTAADGAPLALAGIWLAWGAESMLTCSVVTTAALGDLARVHDRMPLILPPERWAAWLAGGGDPVEQVRPLSAAALATIEVRPVRPDVGNVRNNGPELLEASVEATLF